VRVLSTILKIIPDFQNLELVWGVRELCNGSVL